jgi:hypothetical protein
MSTGNRRKEREEINHRLRGGDRDVADAYAEVTDGCRLLIAPASHIVRQTQRVKPDPETNPLAELDYEKEPTSFRAASPGY